MGFGSMKKRTKRILALILAFVMLMGSFSDFRLVVKADTTATEGTEGGSGGEGEQPGNDGQEPGDGGNGNGEQTQTTLTVTFVDDVAETVEYTGGAIVLPGLIVMDGEESLDSENYTVEWSEGVEGNAAEGFTVTNAGTYTCTVTATEDTTKVGQITFEVTPKSIEDATVSGIEDVTFGGSNVSGLDGLTVRLDENAELSDSDYTVTYADSESTPIDTISKEGIYTLTITGIGNYTGTLTKDLKVTRDISTIDNLSIDSDTYNGQAVTISGLIVNGLNCDYSVSYTTGEGDNVTDVSIVTDAGTYLLTVTANDESGIYTGSKKVEFVINQLDLVNCEVTVEPSEIPYTGNEVEPSIKVIYDGFEVPDENYSVTYSGTLVEKGEYTATVTAKDGGNLCGSTTADFSIKYTGIFNTSDTVNTTIDVTGLNMSYHSDKYYYNLSVDEGEKKVTIRPNEGYEFVAIVSETSDKIETTLEDGALVITFVTQDIAVISEGDIVIGLKVKDSQNNYNEISLTLAEAPSIEFAADAEVSVSYNKTYTGEDGTEWADKITGIEFPQTTGVGDVTYYYSLKDDKSEATSFIPNSMSDYIVFESEKTYYYWAEDEVDKQTEVLEFRILKLDTTAPMITVKKNTADTDTITNGATIYWNAAEAADDNNGGKQINISVEATDSESRLVDTYLDGIVDSFAVVEGTVSSTVISQSISDNVENSAAHTFTAVYDPIAPSVEAELSTSGNITEDSTTTNMLSSDDVIITFKITGEALVNGITLLDKVVITDDAAKVIKSFEVGELTYSGNGAEAYYEGTYTVETDKWLKNTYTITAFDEAGNQGETSVIVEIDKLVPEIAENGISIEPNVTGNDGWTKVDTEFVVTVPNVFEDKDSNAKIYLEYKKEAATEWIRVSEYTEDTNGNLIFRTSVEMDEVYEGNYQFRVSDTVHAIDIDSAEVISYTLKKDKVAPDSTAYIKFYTDTTGENVDDWAKEESMDSWYSNIASMTNSLWNKIWGKEKLSFEIYVKDEFSGVQSVTFTYEDGEEITISEPIDGIKVSLSDADADSKYTATEADDAMYNIFKGEITLPSSEVESISYTSFKVVSIKDKADNEYKNDIVLKTTSGETTLYLDKKAPALNKVAIAGNELTDAADKKVYYNAAQTVTLEIEERFFTDAKEPVVKLASRTDDNAFIFNDNTLQSLTWTEKEETKVYTTTISLPISDTETEYQIQISYQDGSGNMMAAADGTSFTVNENGVYVSPIIVIDGSAPELTQYEISEVTNKSYGENNIPVYKNEADDDISVSFTIDDNELYWNTNNVEVKVYTTSGELVASTYVDETSNIEQLNVTWDEFNGNFSFDGKPDENGGKITADSYYVTIFYEDLAKNKLEDDPNNSIEGTITDGIYMSKEFILDHVAPEFNISYNTPYRNVIEGNAVAEDEKIGVNGVIELQPKAGYTSYYNKEIVATFTIDEQYANFANGLSDSTITVYKDGEVISLENNPTVKLTWAAQETTYTGTLTIKADEENNVSADGSYQIEINYNDTAMNKMIAGEMVNGSDVAAPVTDGTYKSTTLVLDTTAPAVTFKYVDAEGAELAPSNTVGTRNYFIPDVTMQVIVEDVNLRNNELKHVLLDKMTAVNSDGTSMKETTTPYTEVMALSDTNIITDEVVIPLALTPETNYTFTCPSAENTENYESLFIYEDLAGNKIEFATQELTIDKTAPDKNAIWIQFESDVKGSFIDKIVKIWNSIWGRNTIGFTVYVRDEISDIASMEMVYNVNTTNDQEVQYSTTNGTLTINDKVTLDDGKQYVPISGSIIVENNSDLVVNNFRITSLVDMAGNNTCETEEIKFTTNGTTVGSVYLDAVAPKLTGVTIGETSIVDKSVTQSDIKPEEKPYYYNEAVTVVLKLEERFFEDVRALGELPKVQVGSKTSKDNNFVFGDVLDLEWTKVTGSAFSYTANVELPLITGAETEYQLQMFYNDGADNLMITEVEGLSVDNMGTFTSETIIIADIAPELKTYAITENSDREVNGISVYKNVDSDDVTVTFILDENAEYWNGYQNQLLITVKNAISGTELITMNGSDAKIAWTENGRKHTGTFTFDGEDAIASNYLVTISYTNRAGNEMVIDNAAITEGSHTGNTYTSKEFILDHVAPEFNISYTTPYRNVKDGNAVENDVLGADNENLQPQTGYTSYYGEEIVATFTIDEQYANFANGLADSTITVYKNGEAISLANNPTVKLTWATQEKEVENQKPMTIYTGTLTIKADEENNVSADGNYQIEINYNDTAMNKMIAGEMVNGSDVAAPVTDGTYKSTTLVLDTTAPAVTFKYVDAEGAELAPSNTVGTRNYFIPDVTMQVIVEDVNLRNNELKHALLDKMTAVNSDGTSMKETTTPYTEVMALSDTNIITDEVVIPLALTPEANYTFTCPSEENTPNYDEVFIYEDLAGNKIEFVTQEVTADKTAPDENAIWIQIASDIEGLNDENVLNSAIRKIKDAWNAIWGRNTINFTVYVRDEISDIASMEMCYNADTENGGQIIFKTSDGTLTMKEKDTLDDGKQYVPISGSITVTEGTDLLLNNFRITSLIDVAGNNTGEVQFSTNGVAGDIYLDAVAPKLTGVTIGETSIVDKSVTQSDIKPEEKPYYYNEAVTVVLKLEERFFEDVRALGELPKVQVGSKTSKDNNFVFCDVLDLEWTKVTGSAFSYTANVELPLITGAETEYQIQMSYSDGADNLMITEVEGLSVDNMGTFTSETIIIDNIAPKLTNYAITETPSNTVNGISVYKNVNSNDVTVTFALDDNAEYWNGYQNQLLITVENAISGAKLLEMDGTNSAITWSENERVHAGTFIFDGEDMAASNYLVTISYTDRAGNTMVIDNAAITEGSHTGNTYTSKEFILDHVAPEFNISYTTPYRNVKDGNAVAEDKKVGVNNVTELQPETGYTSYYGEEIVATFTIDEQYANFANGLDDSTITVYKDGEVISLENNPTVKLTWATQEKEVENQKPMTIYTGTLTIKADKENNVSADGSYQIEIKYFDTAKNDMIAGEMVYGSNVEAPVTGGTYKSTTLVLDTTEPVITFKYVDAEDGELAPSNTVGTRNYFIPDVTMQVIVEDVNLRNYELEHALLDKMTAVNSDGTSMKETTTPYTDVMALVDTNIITNKVVIPLALTPEANYTFTCPSAENTENYGSLFIYEDLAGNKIKFETQEVTADKTIPDKVNVWIQFTSDVEGLNDKDVMSKNDDDIIQSLIQKITEIWNKIWGRNTVNFTVYVRDEIADIASMEMSYNADTEDGTEVHYATSDTAENKLTFAEEKAVIGNTKYVAISGSITVADDTDLLVNNFRITSLVDNAGNDACKEGEITFSTGGASIYLDAVTPKLTGAVINADELDSEKIYYYSRTVEVALTIEERFFEEARELGRAPIIEVYVKESTDENYTQERVIREDFVNADAEKVWKKNTNGKYKAIVNLPLVEEKEKEYLIRVSYTDGSDNLLDTTDTRLSVNDDGIYTSPVIIIDDINPELTNFAFAGPTYEIKENANPFEANVYNNNVETNDITVNFTIDDNAKYWRNENLTITVRDIINKKAIVVMKGDNANISWSNVERNHTGSFVFDGEGKEASNYEVILSYKDLAVKDMQQGGMVTDGTTDGGTYISKDVILDHVVPVFNLSYTNKAYRLVSNADNNAAADKKAALPETNYTAYYKEDIQVAFTIDEQYAIPVYEDIVDEKAVPAMIGLKDYKLTIKNMLTGKALTEEELPEITWSIKDNGIGEPKQYRGTFVIDKDGTYQISMSYKDTALNAMTAGSTINGELNAGTVKDNGTYQSIKLVLDKTTPEIAVTYVDQNTGEVITPENTAENGAIYFAKPVNMKISVKDANLRYHELKEHLLSGLKVTDSKGIDISDSEAEKWIKALNNPSISINGITWDIPLSTEANYVFPIAYEDLAGNVTTYTTQQATVDQVKPDFKLSYSVTNTAFLDAINYKDLGFLFANHKLTIHTDASDEIAGIRIIRYTITDENGVTTVKESLINPTYDSSYEVVLPLETSDFNGTVKAEILDWSNNTSEESHGYIVESEERHNSTGSAKIETKTSPSRSVDGIDYYNTSVALDLTLEDNYSGLRSYEYVAGKDIKESYNYAAEAGADLAKGKEYNITKLFSKEIILDGNINNENGVLVAAKFVDNAGHVATVEQLYNIDTTAPEITVEYDLNTPSFEKFYNQTRTATVKIKERNFSERDVNFTITNTDGEMPSIGGWSESGSGDETVYTCQVVFSADGDYTFTVAFQDLAGNKADYNRTDEFTIDQTESIYTVTYDNNNNLNDYYYAEARTATIDILEHNFDESLIDVVMTADVGGVVPSVSGWRKDGDHNIATVTFATDGDYTFAITGKDMADNEMEAYAQDRFVIDLTAPEVEIFDIVPNSANNGIVTPGIRYFDTNYDINGSSVHMVGYHNGEVEMKGNTSRTDTGVEVKLNDFEHVQAMDDIYTMNAVVSDLAGNSTEASVIFSVNRFGSVYTFDEATNKLVGNAGSYYTNEEQDIVVIETNVDTLEFNKITCNLNGVLTTMVEGEDYTVSESGSDVSWKEYTYTIAKENFVEEGNYLIIIYSTDRALNLSDTNAKGKRIEFVVDKTMPSVLISGVENDGQYRENTRPVTLDIEDNVMLSEVKVILNGEVITYPASEISATDGRLEFIIDSANDWQTLQVIAVDKAGNENVSDEMRFLITANIFVQFFKNETLVWGTAGGVTVAAGGIYWALLARKKRKQAVKK